MPISATGNPTEPARRRTAPRRRPGRRPPRGLTLIELVVVITIMSLLATPAVLRFGGGGLFGGTPPVQRAGAQLQTELARMRDRALFGRIMLGLDPRADGWSWRERDGEGAWQAAGGGTGARIEGLALDWQLDGRPIQPRSDPEAPPALVILPDGRATPFVLRVTAGQTALVCRFDGWGEMACADR